MNPNALWVLFAFVGMWLGISTLLAWMSGWRALVERFPDRDEVPVSRLRLVSGRLGKGSDWNPLGGISYGSCLRIDICPSGMRIAIWWISGPFQRPFFIPWSMISVKKFSMSFMPLIMPSYRLTFGHFGLSELTLRGRAFRRIEASGKLTTV